MRLSPGSNPSQSLSLAKATRLSSSWCPSSRRPITRKVKLIFAGARSHCTKVTPRLSPRLLLATTPLALQCPLLSRPEVQPLSFSISPGDLQDPAPCPERDSIENALR